VFDDLVYDFVIFNKGDDSHGSPAFGTDEGIDTVNIESRMTWAVDPAHGRDSDSKNVPGRRDD